MDSTLTIQVGRIFTTPKGLFGIKLLDGTGGVVLGHGDEGMTKEVAERVLDAIEERVKRKHNADGPALIRAS